MMLDAFSLGGKASGGTVENLLLKNLPWGKTKLRIGVATELQTLTSGAEKWSGTKLQRVIILYLGIWNSRESLILLLCIKLQSYILYVF